jgi:hypothetical protein
MHLQNPPICSRREEKSQAQKRAASSGRCASLRASAAVVGSGRRAEGWSQSEQRAEGRSRCVEKDGREKGRRTAGREGEE